MDQGVDANMLTPIELIKATVDGMAARGFGRIVNITSGAVKAPIDVLGLSNGARSGLTGFVAGVARSGIAANVTINNLLPGPSTPIASAAPWPARPRVRQGLRHGLGSAKENIPAQRFGTPKSSARSARLFAVSRRGT